MMGLTWYILENVVDDIPSHQKKGLFRSAVGFFERKSDTLPSDGVVPPVVDTPVTSTTAPNPATWSTTAYTSLASSSSSSIQHRKAA